MADGNVVEVVAEISTEMRSVLIYLANCAAPQEICGLITKEGRVLPQRNVADDPLHGFDMEVLIDPKIIEAVYHSHPNGRIDLSDDDMEGITALYEHKIGCRYLIVTPSEVHEYELRYAENDYPNTA